jgi:hypothetical protein
LGLPLRVGIDGCQRGRADVVLPPPRLAQVTPIAWQLLGVSQFAPQNFSNRRLR